MSIKYLRCVILDLSGGTTKTDGHGVMPLEITEKKWQFTLNRIKKAWWTQISLQRLCLCCLVKIFKVSGFAL